MTDPGRDWPADTDGVPHRTAARVVLFDPAGRILLAIGHDHHRPDRRWWFTIGGGVEPGETLRAAATRELREETGLVVSPESLEGPALFRRATFRFATVTARQDEWFFLGRTVTTRLDRSGWTDNERDVVEGMRWWEPDALAIEATRTEVFPRTLPALLRRWGPGWDGRLIELDDR